LHYATDFWNQRWQSFMDKLRDMTGKFRCYVVVLGVIRYQISFHENRARKHLIKKSFIWRYPRKWGQFCLAARLENKSCASVTRFNEHKQPTIISMSGPFSKLYEFPQTTCMQRRLAAGLRHPFPRRWRSTREGGQSWCSIDRLQCIAYTMTVGENEAKLNSVTPRVAMQVTLKKV
jgi:hypothetical protein